MTCEGEPVERDARVDPKIDNRCSRGRASKAKSWH